MTARAALIVTTQSAVPAPAGAAPAGEAGAGGRPGGQPHDGACRVGLGALVADDRRPHAREPGPAHDPGTDARRGDGEPELGEGRGDRPGRAHRDHAVGRARLQAPPQPVKPEPAAARAVSLTTAPAA